MAIIRVQVRPCFVILRLQPIFRQGFFSQLRGFVDFDWGFLRYDDQGTMDTFDFNGFDKADMALFVDEGFYGLFHYLSSFRFIEKIEHWKFIQMGFFPPGTGL